MAIIGNINKLKIHLSNPNLEIVFKYFLNALNKEHKIHKRIFSLKTGAFEKVNLTKDIFALEQVFYTKEREECFFESHKKYIDFQLVLEGSEQMEYTDIDEIEVKTPYNSNRDVTIYVSTDNTSKVLLQRKNLAIFFPDDAHMGLPKFKKSELVFKTVIKLPISLFERNYEY